MRQSQRNTAFLLGAACGCILGVCAGMILIHPSYKRRLARQQTTISELRGQIAKYSRDMALLYRQFTLDKS